MVLKRESFVLLTVMIFSLVATRHAAGQQEAMIYGVVTDESGAVLPGVTVTATSPALQVPSMAAVSGPDGAYRLTPMPIGIYQLDYALQGFQTVRHQNLRLPRGLR